MTFPPLADAIARLTIATDTTNRTATVNIADLNTVSRWLRANPIDTGIACIGHPGRVLAVHVARGYSELGGRHRSDTTVVFAEDLANLLAVCGLVHAAATEQREDEQWLTSLVGAA